MLGKRGFLLHPAQVHLRLYGIPQRLQALPRGLFLLELDLLEVDLRVVGELARNSDHLPVGQGVVLVELRAGGDFG